MSCLVLGGTRHFDIAILDGDGASAAVYAIAGTAQRHVVAAVGNALNVYIAISNDTTIVSADGINVAVLDDGRITAGTDGRVLAAHLQIIAAVGEALNGQAATTSIDTSTVIGDDIDITILDDEGGVTGIDSITTCTYGHSIAFGGVPRDDATAAATATIECRIAAGDINVEVSDDVRTADISTVFLSIDT